MNPLMPLKAPRSWTEKLREMKVDAPSYCDTLSTENDEMTLQQSFPQKQPVVPRTTGVQKGAAFKRTASVEDQRTVRGGMVRLIEKRLAQLNTKKENYPLPQLAQALEEHLYKTAPSFREHTDSRTLSSRIRLVTVALLRRRAKKNHKLTRGHMLKKVLGEERCLEAAELVQEVKLLRLKRLARNCPGYKGKPGCISDGKNPPLEKQESVPAPMRSLFFNTALVQAFETTPTERIPQLDWDTMMEEARLNVQTYEEWDQEASLPGYSSQSNSSHVEHGADYNCGVITFPLGDQGN